MNFKKNGGPAFPCALDFIKEDGSKTHLTCDGMTLRDYFAAKAMQSLIQGKELSMIDQKASCHIAYILSDEMLKARDA